MTAPSYAMIGIAFLLRTFMSHHQHFGAAVSTVASQPEGLGFDSYVRAYLCGVFFLNLRGTLRRLPKDMPFR